MSAATEPHLRPLADGEERAAADVWLRSGLDEYDYLPRFQALDRDTAFAVFRQHILPDAKLWVSLEQARIVAFMALQDELIDRLYVDPSAQRRGHGAALLGLAKRLHPSGLRLFTHQQNHRARRFYETHGFEAFRFGVSPPPESMPDVEYRWPAAGGPEAEGESEAGR